MFVCLLNFSCYAVVLDLVMITSSMPSVASKSAVSIRPLTPSIKPFCWIVYLCGLESTALLLIGLNPIFLTFFSVLNTLQPSSKFMWRTYLKAQ